MEDGQSVIQRVLNILLEPAAGSPEPFPLINATVRGGRSHLAPGPSLDVYPSESSAGLPATLERHDGKVGSTKSEMTWRHVNLPHFSIIIARLIEGHSLLNVLTEFFFFDKLNNKIAIVKTFMIQLS